MSFSRMWNINLHFVPLFLVEHLIVSLNPESSKSDGMKKMPNECSNFNLLSDVFTKIVLHSKESPIMTSLGLIKCEHDMDGPFPCFASLEAIPKPALKPLLGNVNKRNVCLPFNATTLCQMNQRKATSFS